MHIENLSCPTKLQEPLSKFVAPGVTVEVNTSKESACSTPQIQSVELRLGKEFVILGKGQYASALQVSTAPTPKLVKKIKVTGSLTGVVISKVFDEGQEYDAKDFASALTAPLTETFEEPEV